jgi:hypothetical protein
VQADERPSAVKRRADRLVLDIHFNHVRVLIEHELECRSEVTTGVVRNVAKVDDQLAARGSTNQRILNAFVRSKYRRIHIMEGGENGIGVVEVSIGQTC